MKLLLRITVTFCCVLKIHSIRNVNLCGQLYLTQSPNKDKDLQINWSFDCKSPPDTVVLTFKNVTKDQDAQILHRISPGSVSRGYHQTHVSFKEVPFPGNWTEDNDSPDLNAKCFDFYITSVKNEQVVYSQCLSIQPTWMSNFGNMRIGNLMIPGTHNSGAYKGGPSLIRSYVLNQDKSFWQQLVYGIRYFDIRVGKYSDGLYLNHAFIKCTKLLPELESVENFLRKSPKEVVILNFYRFPHPRNFSKSYHEEILGLVKQVFGNLIYPFYFVKHRKGPKLSEFWTSQQRVIISYRNDEIVRANSWLWPSVRRNWGNLQKVPELENYIKAKLSEPVMGNPMHVLMAELTPNYYNILKHVTRNLKDLSILVNRELSGWIRQNNRSDNLNIIATDFFTGNDVINAAIETNLRKSKFFYT